MSNDKTMLRKRDVGMAMRPWSTPPCIAEEGPLVDEHI